MAQLTAFQFQPGTSLLHATDVRFKLVFLVAAGFSALNISPLALAGLATAVIAAVFYARLPFAAFLREVRFFLLFLVAIWLLRAFSDVEAAPLQIGGITLSRTGIYQGSLICLRLLLVMLAGWIFVATTLTFQIKAAIHWFLRPLPGVPAAKIAVMVGLLARFIPLVFEKSRQIQTAQKARAIVHRKSPFYRIKKFTIPLVRSIFEDADRLVLAMEARYFNENRTDPSLAAQTSDWVLLIVATLFFISLFML